MLTRPLTQPLTGPLARGVGEGGFISAFNPANLFAGVSKGIALDLTNKSKLYQDSARTTLVSANGDPIGSPTDLSGNGAHPTQATTASKPLFQGYADLDGVDDGWVTPTIDFSGTDRVTVVAGLYKGSDAGTAIVLELSASSSANNGAFLLLAPPGTTSPSYTFRSRGTVAADSRSALSYPAPHAGVVTGRGNISGDVAGIRVNGAAELVDSTDQGTGNYGNYPLYIGRRGASTLPFTGRLYRLIVIGRALTASELAQAERWCATATGVTLP